MTSSHPIFFLVETQQRRHRSMVVLASRRTLAARRPPRPLDSSITATPHYRILWLCRVPREHDKVCSEHGKECPEHGEDFAMCQHTTNNTQHSFLWPRLFLLCVFVHFNRVLFLCRVPNRAKYEKGCPVTRFYSQGKEPATRQQ
jgi:hypothetical protein